MIGENVGARREAKDSDLWRLREQFGGEQEKSALPGWKQAVNSVVSSMSSLSSVGLITILTASATVFSGNVTVTPGPNSCINAQLLASLPVSNSISSHNICFNKLLVMQSNVADVS